MHVELTTRIKETIVTSLRLEQSPAEISEDVALFGEGLGLDSIDALDLAVALEAEFQVPMNNREAYRSVATLAAHVERELAKVAGGAPAAPEPVPA